MAFNSTPPNSTSNLSQTSSAGDIGEIKPFASKRAMASSGKFLPLDGNTYSWSDYPEFNTAMDSIPPVISAKFTSNSASEQGSNEVGAHGAFKSFGTAVWVFPSKTGGTLTTVTGSAWGDATAADASTAWSGTPKNIVTRADDGGEGCLVTFNSGNSSVDYTTASSLTSGYTTLDLNSLVSVTASSVAQHACNSGASGRWYVLFGNSNNLQIAYSGVDTVNTGWALWAGTVTSPTSTNIQQGSIAVKEGSMWMWSAKGTTAASAHGKIYGATSLGGTASLLLDISPSEPMHFFLHYDIDEGIFIAVPDRGGYPIYTSSDDGTTWLAGDVVTNTPMHKPMKYDSTAHVYILPYNSAVTQYDELFTAMKRDSDGYMRLITMQEASITKPGEYYQVIANNTSRMIVANPDNSLAAVGVSNTGAYEVNITQDLSTEFATINTHNHLGVGTNSAGIGVPIGNFLGMRVKT